MLSIPRHQAYRPIPCKNSQILRLWKLAVLLSVFNSHCRLEIKLSSIPTLVESVISSPQVASVYLEELRIHMAVLIDTIQFFNDVVYDFTENAKQYLANLDLGWKLPQQDQYGRPILRGLLGNLFIYYYLFGVLRRFQHCTGHITMGSWKGRGNQYIQFVRVLYCKLPTNGKQLPAFPLEAVPVSRPQRWEARVLPLCHRGPRLLGKSNQSYYHNSSFLFSMICIFPSLCSI